MPKRQFFVMALFCGLEAYFLNQAIWAGKMTLAFFLACLLVRDLHQSYQLTKISQAILAATKKKD